MTEREALELIAAIVNASADDLPGLVFAVREKIREGDRWTARMLLLQKHIELARKALDGGLT